MEIFGGRLDLPYEFTYSIMAISAGLISFCTVKLNIRFSYYFFMLTRNRAAVLASKTGEERRRYKLLLTFMFINLLSPILVILLFI